MSKGHTERLEAALDGKYRIKRELGEGGIATVTTYTTSVRSRSRSSSERNTGEY
jgi:hypothetical protein